MRTHKEVPSAPDQVLTGRRTAPYYESLDKGCDELLRCNECGRLVTHAALFRTGGNGLTPCCGTRRVREVRHLTFWEWLKIRVGFIDFPYRHEFLAEFKSERHAEVPHDLP